MSLELLSEKCILCQRDNIILCDSFEEDCPKTDDDEKTVFDIACFKKE